MEKKFPQSVIYEVPKRPWESEKSFSPAACRNAFLTCLRNRVPQLRMKLVCRACAFAFDPPVDRKESLHFCFRLQFAGRAVGRADKCWAQACNSFLSPRHGGLSVMAALQLPAFAPTATAQERFDKLGETLGINKNVTVFLCKAPPPGLG